MADAFDAWRIANDEPLTVTVDGEEVLAELEALEPIAQARMAEARTSYLAGHRAGQGQLFTVAEARPGGSLELEAAGQLGLFEVVR